MGATDNTHYILKLEKQSQAIEHAQNIVRDLIDSTEAHQNLVDRIRAHQKKVRDKYRIKTSNSPSKNGGSSFWRGKSFDNASFSKTNILGFNKTIQDGKMS